MLDSPASELLIRSFRNIRNVGERGIEPNGAKKDNSSEDANDTSQPPKLRNRSVLDLRFGHMSLTVHVLLHDRWPRGTYILGTRLMDPSKEVRLF